MRTAHTVRLFDPTRAPTRKIRENLEDHKLFLEEVSDWTRKQFRRSRNSMHGPKFGQMPVGEVACSCQTRADAPDRFATVASYESRLQDRLVYQYVNKLYESSKQNRYDIIS